MSRFREDYFRSLPFVQRVQLEKRLQRATDARDKVYAVMGLLSAE